MAISTDVVAAGLARFARRKADFEKIFEEYFVNLLERLDIPPLSRFAPQSVELLRELSLRRGKRLRLGVLYEAARLVETGDVPGLQDAALSVELLHTHGLVLDDLIDDGAVRRGGPSTYYAYREQFPERGRTAVGLTVMAGDLAAFLSVQVLLEADLPADLRVAMLGVQAEAATSAVLGQVMDLERDFQALPDENFLHATADYKSGRYSVLAPMRLGLLAAGGDLAAHDGRLRRYSRFVSISEQMRDDYLDLFGDEAHLGKPVGADIREGRRSYPVRVLLTVTEGAERDMVEAALGDRHCGPEQILRIRDLARARAVDEIVLADMRRYAHHAANEAMTWHGIWAAEAVDFFAGFPLLSVERTR